MLKKLNILNIFIYIIFIVIIIRLYYLQIIKHDYYEELLNSMNIEEVLENVPRGKIYDTNGILLVDNTLVKTIYYKKIDGISVKEEIELAYKIKDYIELDYSKLTKSYLKEFYLLTHENEINNRINKIEFNNYKKRLITDIEYYNLKLNKISDLDLNIYNDDDKKAIYLYYLMNNGYSYEEKIIKENVSDLEFAYFSENNDKLLGFDTKYTYDRYYVYGDTLKTIFGKVGNITSENKEYYLNKGYSISDIVGLSNLEFIYDDYLNGDKEIYKIINNEKILYKKGRCGYDLYLTIDINIQENIDLILENELIKAKSSINTKYFDHSYVSLTNPNDGGVIALSGKVYNNNLIYDYSIGNITDTMVSGSVVKGVSILVGYNENIIKIGEYTIDECIKLKSTPLKCSISNMGYINDLDAIRKSSNSYQFKIALKLAGINYKYNTSAYIDESAFSIYRKYFSLFGLGSKTGIDLENESSGYKGNSIDAGLLMNLAIGQYDSYTNLELNQYISTLINGVNRYKLHLIKEIKNKDQVIYTYEKEILNDLSYIKEEYINRVKIALKQVMTNGTGINYIDLSLDPYGKTGTSETFIFNDTNTIKTISTSFVGYFKSNNLEYAISIQSPNISYINNSSSYIYPFNKIVISNITNSFI